MKTTATWMSALAVLAAIPALVAIGPAGSAQTVAEPLNVLLVTTDDQWAGELRYMPHTRRLLGGAGARFEGISPHPLCCPARAEILTGQYAQNNGVRSNAGPVGGYAALQDPGNTLATWLDAAGYETSFLGKFLNHSQYDHVPAGWDNWHATYQGGYNTSHYKVSWNGQGTVEPDEHQTDYFSMLASTKITEAHREDQPFFIWQSFLAPHSEYRNGRWVYPVAAKRHRDEFRDAKPPSLAKPSWNHPVHDKPLLRGARKLGRRRVTQRWRAHLRSLQTVDEGVLRMVRALRSHGELDNTLIIFTSDNGFMHGEHRHRGKELPYEESMEVPFLMRGPGIPAGRVDRRVAATIDIAPTIVAATGVSPGRRMDGRVLLPRRAGWNTVLIQGGPVPKANPAGWQYRGVRTGRYTMFRVWETGEKVLFDRRRDPYQLNNMWVGRKDRRMYRPVMRELRWRMWRLVNCQADECRRRFGAVPRPR